MTNQPQVKIRVALADDQVLIRQGLRYIVNTQDDMEVVGEAADGAEAVLLTKRTHPDLVLMDIQMPRMTGIEATRAILTADPQVRVVLLTTFDVDEYVYEGIRAGAVGYLLKDAQARDLFDAIRAAHRGEAIYRTSAAARMLAQALAPDEASRPGAEPADEHGPGPRLLEPLTERERDVLQHMAYGKRNLEIAELLCVTEGTVKTHVHRILQKLNAEDRTQAVVFAIRQRLVK